MTKRQSDAMQYLRRWFAAHDRAPTLSEIAAGLDISKTAAHGLVEQLRRQGLVSRDDERYGSLRLTDDPRDRVVTAARALLAAVRAETPEADIALAELG